ncbi:hypothetical protein ACHQM5_010637 [Ranunculus cassubicifolius]
MPMDTHMLANCTGVYYYYYCYGSGLTSIKTCSPYVADNRTNEVALKGYGFFPSSVREGSIALSSRGSIPGMNQSVMLD